MDDKTSIPGFVVASCGRRHPRPCPRRRRKSRFVGGGRGRSSRHHGQASGNPVIGAACELLADLLLELNQPAAALVEYRAMLSTDPNRFRSLLGDACAVKQTGDSATAHDAYGKLMALSKPVGPARPELAEAKSYLTN
jgi:hypothetical protein